MPKCIKCGKQTDLHITIDIDIKGLAVCEKHKTEVKGDLAIVLLASRTEKDDVYEWLEEKYNLNKSK